MASTELGNLVRPVPPRASQRRPHSIAAPNTSAIRFSSPGGLAAHFVWGMGDSLLRCLVPKICGSFTALYNCIDTESAMRTGRVDPPVYMY
jgi:hypothetical protein